MSIKDEIREFFKEMTREELIQHLKDAGFNVSEGTGKIIFTDDEDSMKE